MKIRAYKLSMFFLICLVMACKPTSDNKKLAFLDSIKLAPAQKVINSFDTIGQGLPIFYNMYLSVELSSLFQTAGAIFKTDLMNSPDRISSYLTSSQQAVNLGVFAVDLSYARVCDQVEVAGRYFNAMQQISRELGIPDEYFKNTAERFERNIEVKDSLIKIANEVYVTTDNYLKENERYNTAALIIMGGWVEAIYIATDVAIESRDADIIEKLIDQKYSLSNVILMLSEHKKNEIIGGYLAELFKIRKEFDKLNIVFNSGFNANTPEGKEYIDGSIHQLSNFRKVIKDFRDKLTK